MDAIELNAFAMSVCEATLRLEDAAQGRQNDDGADLRPAGVLIIPLAKDAGVPGAIFSADLVSLRKGLQEWHRIATIRDGAAGGDKNVKPGGGGDASAILALLSGHLMPGVLGQLTQGGDPLRLLASLLGGKK